MFELLKEISPVASFIAIIVGTITILKFHFDLKNEINNLKIETKEEINNLKIETNNQITSLKANLEKMDSKIEKMDSKIDSNFAVLNERLNSTNIRLDYSYKFTNGTYKQVEPQELQHY